jgi:hypothetical protein
MMDLQFELRRSRPTAEGNKAHRDALSEALRLRAVTGLPAARDVWPVRRSIAVLTVTSLMMIEGFRLIAGVQSVGHRQLDPVASDLLGTVPARVEPAGRAGMPRVQFRISGFVWHDTMRVLAEASSEMRQLEVSGAGR